MSPMLPNSQLDEIAVDYIVSVLQQQLGEDESFGVEEFIYVMTAYIPELGDINRYADSLPVSLTKAWT